MGAGPLLIPHSHTPLPRFPIEPPSSLAVTLSNQPWPTFSDCHFASRRVLGIGSQAFARHGLRLCRVIKRVLPDDFMGV